MKPFLSILVFLFVGQVYAGEPLTVTGVSYYPAPGAELVENVNLEIENGRITRITRGKSASRGQRIHGKGLTASYGFWNSHVHFTDPRVLEDPQGVLDDMLLQYGFTQVLDTGSYLVDTLRLKQQIVDGKLRGPAIYTANGSFVYKDGTPAYLPPDLKLPEAATPEEGAALTEYFLGEGADGIKIFSGSFQTPEETIYLPVPVIRAIADAAHARDSFVVAHPTTVLGFSNAVEGGVHVMAHTTSAGSVISEGTLKKMQAKNIALIPTLSLWRYEMMKFTGSERIADAVEGDAIAQMQQLLAADIEILFGTDVGYMTEFDTRREFALLRRAGMDWPAIHHALTVGPARRFSKEDAVLEAGARANIVLLEGDPATDITALSNVAYTIIDGKVVYRRAD